MREPSFKLPSAWLPVAMSLVGLGMILALQVAAALVPILAILYLEM